MKAIRPGRPFLWLTLLLLSLLTIEPARAQITTNTALPVAKGEGILRLQSRILRSTGDPTSMDRDLTVVAFPVVGVFGVHPRLAVFGVVPIISKNMNVSNSTGRIERSTFGIGDVRVFVRYTAFQKNKRGQTIRVAPFIGVEAPTGNDSEVDEFGRLPQPFQLGSGSWDPFAGIVFTWQTLDWQLDASPSYSYFAKANDFQFGEVARVDVAFKYRLLPRTLSRSVSGFFYVNLESNLLWRGRNEVNGAGDPNSGGKTWYLAPGLQYVTRRFVIEAAVQLPAAEDLGGTAVENDFVTILSTRVKF